MAGRNGVPLKVGMVRCVLGTAVNLKVTHDCNVSNDSKDKKDKTKTKKSEVCQSLPILCTGLTVWSNVLRFEDHSFVLTSPQNTQFHNVGRVKFFVKSQQQFTDVDVVFFGSSGQRLTVAGTKFGITVAGIGKTFAELKQATVVVQHIFCIFTVDGIELSVGALGVEQRFNKEFGKTRDGGFQVGVGDIKKVSGVDHAGGSVAGPAVVGQKLFVSGRSWVRGGALEQHVLQEMGEAGCGCGV